jgi:hypothetical protein
MVSWLNLLSGAGMIAVGAIAVYAWRRRAAAEFFLFGAVFWAAAIAVKVAMDLTMTVPFRDRLPPALAGALALGLYYGLRTGILESGIPYVVARASRLKPTFDQAVAVGIGFGAAEAILLGFGSLASVLAFILSPAIISSYPPDTQDVLRLQFSLWFIPIPVWERLFTLINHVFATVLALYAARAGAGLAGKKWLALSMAIGVVVDGAIFWFAYFIPSSSVAYILALEAFVAAVGLASIAGLFILRGQYDWHAPQA